MKKSVGYHHLIYVNQPIVMSKKSRHLPPKNYERNIEQPPPGNTQPHKTMVHRAPALQAQYAQGLGEDVTALLLAEINVMAFR